MSTELNSLNSQKVGMWRQENSSYATGSTGHKVDQACLLSSTDWPIYSQCADFPGKFPVHRHCQKTTVIILRVKYDIFQSRGKERETESL